MSRLAIRVPPLPDCWESCGNCSDGELAVAAVLVSTGQWLRRFDPIIVLEADKTTLEVPTLEAGCVAEVCVAVGDRVSEGTCLLVLESEASR